jgi:hypothetical protein
MFLHENHVFFSLLAYMLCAPQSRPAALDYPNSAAFYPRSLFDCYVLFSQWSVIISLNVINHLYFVMSIVFSLR